FLFMATHKERFGTNVVADIRGWLSPDGRSPFWEHIPAKFFHTTFDEADRLSASDFRFISHLMPKFPIYVSLLPDAAQDAIGKPHDKSAYALKTLRSEGFQYTKCIDIFDGGPSIECPLDNIRTVTSLSPRTITISDTTTHIDGAETLMVTSAPNRPFAAVLGQGHPSGHTVVVTPQIAKRAGLSGGEKVFASPLKG
ncbi:MAG: arginine N-succinyltransferase, partial [Pseudomonadota bacterium]